MLPDVLAAYAQPCVQIVPPSHLMGHHAMAEVRGGRIFVLVSAEVPDRDRPRVIARATRAALGVRPANDTSRALPRFRTHQASS